MVTRRSLSDRRMIDDLERGREWLLSEPSSQNLLSILRRKLQSITRNVYVLACTPEQAEDPYDLLVDGTTIVRIEIPRDAGWGDVVFERWGIEEYLSTRKLGKPDCRKLELALGLARSRASAFEQ